MTDQRTRYPVVAPWSHNQGACNPTDTLRNSVQTKLALTGIPVEELNLARTGVLAALKCGALDSSAALDVGVKVPRSKRPLA
jgi:hypothetical protein